jgi:AAA domain
MKRAFAAVAAPTFNSHKENDKRQGMSKKVIFEHVVRPLKLPAQNNYYEVTANDGWSYQGIIPDIRFDGCFWAFEFNLSVTHAKKAKTFNIEKIIDYTPLPLTWGLLQRVYRKFLNKKHSREFSQVESDDKLMDIVLGFQQSDFLRAFLTPIELENGIFNILNAANHETSIAKADELLNGIINTQRFTDEEEEKECIKFKESIKVNEDIFDLDVELGEMHATSDYFITVRGFDSILHHNYPPGYKKLFPQEFLDTVLLMMKSKPFDLFFESTLPPLVPRFGPKVALGLSEDEKVLVQSYSNYLDVRQSRIYSESTCLPVDVLNMKPEIKQVLLDKKLMIEEIWPDPFDLCKVKTFLYDAYTYRAEELFVDYLYEFIHRDPIIPHTVNEHILEGLDDYQIESVRNAATKRVFITNGPAGYGKTTCEMKILIMLAYFMKLNVLLLTPTGRVKEKSVDDLCDFEADWIDSNTFRSPEYYSNRNTLNKLDEVSEEHGKIVIRNYQSVSYDSVVEKYPEYMSFDVVIFTESSMLPIQDLYDIFKTLPNIAQIGFSGDYCQLGPPGTSSIFKYICEIPLHPNIGKVELKISHRADEACAEIFKKNFTKILNHSAYFGNMSGNISNGHFHYIQAPPSRSEGIKLVVDTALQVMKLYNMTRDEFLRRVLVTSFYTIDVTDINSELRKVLFPETTEDEYTYQVGEKVVFNTKVSGDDCDIGSKGIRYISRILQLDSYMDRKTNRRVFPKTKNDIFAMRNTIAREHIFVDVPYVCKQNWARCKIHFSRYTKKPMVDIIDTVDIPDYVIVRAFCFGIYQCQSIEMDIVLYHQSSGNFSTQMVTPNSVYTAFSRAKQKIILIGNIPLLDSNLKESRKRRVYSTFLERYKELCKKNDQNNKDRELMF